MALTQIPEPFYDFIGKIPDTTLIKATKEILIWKKTGLRPKNDDNGLDEVKRLITENLGLVGTTDVIRLAEVMILDEIARRYIINTERNFT